MARIVVLGGAESGVGAAVLAKVKGFDVFLSDNGTIKEDYAKVLREWDIPFEQGGHTPERILNADEVVKSPGIPSTAPETAVVFLGRHPDTPKAAETARKLADRGTRVIAVSLYTPRCLDLLPDSVWKIAAWQYDPLAVDAVIRLLRASC